MSTMPTKLLERLEWCENHVEPWTTNAVAIGSSAVEVAAFQAKVEAARAARTAAEEARQAARNATLTQDEAVEAMTLAAQGIIKQARAKAEATHNPNVYVLASIPAPATPTPVGNPGTPFDFKVELYQNGALDLSWKCTNPAGCTGVTYQVWRRIGGTGELAYLGGVGQRKFLDAQIPSGASLLTYQIQAVRSTGVGNWATFNVSFGPVTPEMPAGTVSVTPAAGGRKIAA